MKNSRKIFILIALISTLGQITSDLYLPSLPFIATYFGVSFQLSKLTLSFYMMSFAVSPLFYGPLSDAIGRRKPLIFGLSLCSLGSLICLFATSIHLMLIGRLLQGAGAGAASALFRPMLRDLFDKTALAKYGSYAALISVATLTFAPLAGGYLQHLLGWKSNFYVLISLSLIALICIVFLVPETNRFQHSENLTIQKIKTNLYSLLFSRAFMAYSFLNFLTYGAILAWLTSGPILMQEAIGLTPISFGWLYVLTGLCFALGAICNGRWVGRLGTEKMLGAGILILFLAGIMMLVFSLNGLLNAVVIIAPVMLVLFSAPLIFNNAFAGAFQAFPHIAGMAGAIFSVLTTLGGAATSMILANFKDNTQLPMSIVIMSCAFAALLIYFLVIFKLTSSTMLSVDRS